MKRYIKVDSEGKIEIPQEVLHHIGAKEELEIILEDGVLTLRVPAREGWEEQFRMMVANNDDMLMDESVSTSTWDDTEWEW